MRHTHALALTVRKREGGMKISIAITMMICESYGPHPPFFSIAETLRGSFFDQRSSVLRSAAIPPVETRHLRWLVTQRLKKGADESLTTGQGEATERPERHVRKKKNR